MTIHEDAVDLVQYCEGCQNEAYACPAHVSRGGLWPHLTIGYGHTGPDVYAGLRITTAQARELLARDLDETEAAVRKLIAIRLTETQIGAVCALVMNVGIGAFKRSRALAMLNKGTFGHFDTSSALDPEFGELSGMAREWAEFRSIRRADGAPEISRGLVKRRAMEMELFFTGRWSVPGENRLPQSVAEPHSAQSRMLRPGSRSQDIADLHSALAHAGFPATCQDAYTWVTSDAVRAFQKSHGLTPDGIYGPETSAKLNQVINGGGP